MSKTLMGQKDIPKYVMALLPRLEYTQEYEETGIVGYTWKLFGRNRIGGEKTLYNEADRLVKWAKRYYADSYIVANHFWYDDLPEYGDKGTKWHMRRAYKSRHHNYITLVITDPVAKQIEIAKRILSTVEYKKDVS